MASTAHIGATVNVSTGPTDPDKEELFLRRVDADGNTILTRANIVISRLTLETLCKPLDDGGEGLTNKKMEIIIERAKDTSCNPVKRAVLATPWEPDV